jgi:hypothetical protein
MGQIISVPVLTHKWLVFFEARTIHCAWSCTNNSIQTVQTSSEDCFEQAPKKIKKAELKLQPVADFKCSIDCMGGEYE